jgi:hypothetical protein
MGGTQSSFETLYLSEIKHLEKYNIDLFKTIKNSFNNEDNENNKISIRRKDESYNHSGNLTTDIYIIKSKDIIDFSESDLIKLFNIDYDILINELKTKLNDELAKKFNEILNIKYISEYSYYLAIFKFIKNNKNDPHLFDLVYNILNINKNKKYIIIREFSDEYSSMSSHTNYYNIKIYDNLVDDITNTTNKKYLKQKFLKFKN